MALWEAVLFLLVSIAGGFVLVTLLCWLISLPERKPQTTWLGALTSLFTDKNPEAGSVIKQQAKVTDSKLMAEVENNLRITSEPWTGDLIPYDTSVWDAEQYEVYQLPTNLRNDLKQVYADIGLANQIAWLAQEFNRRSPEVDESYKRMRTSIAERLLRIKQNVE